MTIDEGRMKEFFLFYLLKRAERSDIHNSSIVIRHSMKFHTRGSGLTSKLSRGLMNSDGETHENRTI
jgi:hypothetical protein